MKPAQHPRGFTLLELLVVIAIIALASAVTSLALRDPDATRLSREGQRLATLLEAGRAQSRALGVPVSWVPGGGATSTGNAGGPDFRFEGLPPGQDLPNRWLESPGSEPVQVTLPNRQTSLALGPEPMIGAQRIQLRLGSQQLFLVSDGLGPFTVADE